MKEKLSSLISKKDNIAILFLVLVVIALVAISPFLPDSRPKKLRSELTRQGYSVEHIDFEFIKNVRGDVSVFKSSEPIFHDGYYIEYWELTRRTFGIVWPNLRTVYYVEPYTPKG